MTSAAKRRRRAAFQWPAILFIIVVWSLLWGNFSIANALSGLVVALLVTAVFPLPPIQFAGRVRPAGLARLVFWFVVDLVAASFQVAWLAVRPGPPPRNGVIEVNLHSDSDIYLTLTSELVSLVPGSVVIDVRRSTNTLYVHVIDIGDDIDAARRRVLLEERRVMAALASDSELQAYHEQAAMAAGTEGELS